VTDQTPATAPVTAQDTPGGPGQPTGGPETPQTAPGGFPDVQGRCPACNGASLFLADGGYTTCRRLDCPNPDAASLLLEGLAARDAALIRDQAALAQIRLLIAAHRPRLRLADPILLRKLDRVLEQPAELEAAVAGERP